MAKLKRLINGQDVSFDTHQAGDGQEIHWKAVHLEKSMHGREGKARFPLLEDEEPSCSNMNDKDFQRIKKEVSDVLRKNQGLKKQLAETIVDTLKRFSNGKATSSHATESAKKIANYFDLNEQFLKVVEDYDVQNRLVSFITVHFNEEAKTLHRIEQSQNSVTIKKAHSIYPLKKPNSRKVD